MAHDPSREKNLYYMLNDCLFKIGGARWPVSNLSENWENIPE